MLENIKVKEEIENYAEEKRNRQDGLDTRFETNQSQEVNAGALERDLKRSIKGEVRFDSGSKALYSTDASNYRQIPIGVVLPKTEEDII
ncbi:MAG: hypothetical protein ACXVBT_15120, partial [Flavisolibacter sp.]